MPVHGGVGPWGTTTGGGALCVSLQFWISFSLIYPFQSRQKAKQTSTTSNYHRQYGGETGLCLCEPQDKKVCLVSI